MTTLEQHAQVMLALGTEVTKAAAEVKEANDKEEALEKQVEAARLHSRRLRQVLYRAEERLTAHARGETIPPFITVVEVETAERQEAERLRTDDTKTAAKS